MELIRLKQIHLNIVSDGEPVGQTVELGDNFRQVNIIFILIKGGYTLRTVDGFEVSITIDVDTSKFASVYVKQGFVDNNSTSRTCVDLNPFNWYGGPEQSNQKYPIQKLNFTDFPYVTTESNSAVVTERYWLASNGFFILIDYETPLFVDQNGGKRVCFTAKKQLPYDTYSRGFTFNYRFGASSDTKTTHLNVVNRMLGKPLGIPSEKMVRHPIWNTWVRYRREINQTTISQFTSEIIANGFNHSLIDIDDFWEDCYGSLVVNKTKFPNLKQLVVDLKAKGFAVGLWIHPFINVDCEPFYSEARNQNFLVKSHSGNIFVKWWNSGVNGSTYVDFTNPKAFDWFKSRLDTLRDDYGIEGFKFDAGEAMIQPHDPELRGDHSLSPSLNTLSYLNLAASYGSFVEVLTAWKTQKQSTWVRMLDFDSTWTVNNGLKSLIPTLLQLGMVGYGFVIPGKMMHAILSLK